MILLSGNLAPRTFASFRSGAMDNKCGQPASAIKIAPEHCCSRGYSWPAATKLQLKSGQEKTTGQLSVSQRLASHELVVLHWRSGLRPELPRDDPYGT